MRCNNMDIVLMSLVSVMHRVVREHILLRSSHRCSPSLQTMLRVVGATSDALWGRLLDVHPNPAAAAVVDVSVFKGGQCIDVSVAHTPLQSYLSAFLTPASLLHFSAGKGPCTLLFC